MQCHFIVFIRFPHINAHRRVDLENLSIRNLFYFLVFFFSFFIYLVLEYLKSFYLSLFFKRNHIIQDLFHATV